MTHHEPRAGTPGAAPPNPDMVVERELQADPLLQEGRSTASPAIALLMGALIIGVTLYAVNRPERTPTTSASAPAATQTSQQAPETTGEAPSTAAQKQTGQGRPDNEGNPAQATPAQAGKR